MKGPLFNNEQQAGEEIFLSWKVSVLLLVDTLDKFACMVAIKRSDRSHTEQVIGTWA